MGAFDLGGFGCGAMSDRSRSRSRPRSGPGTPGPVGIPSPSIEQRAITLMFPPTPWCDPAQNASVITLPSAIGHVEDLVINLQAFQRHLRWTFQNMPPGGWSLGIQSLSLAALRGDHRGGSRRPGGAYRLDTIEERLVVELQNLRARAKWERGEGARVLDRAPVWPRWCTTPGAAAGSGSGAEQPMATEHPEQLETLWEGVPDEELDTDTEIGLRWD